MYFSQNTKIEFSEPSYHLDCVFFLCGDCALLILTIQVRMTRRNLCRDIYGCGGQGWGGSVEDKHGQCTYVTVSAWHTRLDLTKLSRSYSTCSDGADSTNFCRLWSGVNFSLWPFYVSTTRLDRRVPWPSMQHHILDTAIFFVCGMAWTSHFDHCKQRDNSIILSSVLSVVVLLKAAWFSHW
jgi:hypothetical protein